MNPGRTSLLVVVVLVGVPLGALAAGRRSDPPVHRRSPAVIADELRAKLRRDGATDIRCEWTRRPKGAFQVTCSGQAGGGSLMTLYELGVVAHAPGG
jgi:hypothetical protein